MKELFCVYGRTGRKGRGESMEENEETKERRRDAKFEFDGGDSCLEEGDFTDSDWLEG